MDEKELVGNCIDKLEGRVLVSPEEKERILTKIGCWSKKPRTEKLVAVMILPVIVIYSFFMAIKQVGHVSCIFFFVLFIVSVLSLIFLYFLGGVWPYYAWKDSVKKIRYNKIMKIQQYNISFISFLLLLIIQLIPFCLFIALMVLAAKALIKYLKSSDIRKEDAIVKKSLGEALKTHRMNCNMTQEFVAETLGVSRQAVSKWETGTSEPSTSNLIAISKLYGVSAEEILKEVTK